MDATYDGREAAKESSTNQPSKKDGLPAPAAPSYPTHYPPTMGYSGHDEQLYQGCSSRPVNAQYPGQYPTPRGYNRHKTLENNGCSPFMRALMTCSCTVTTCIFVGIFVLALVLNPSHPIYEVTSLSVVNLNTTSTSLTGDWSTSFTIQNPNTKLKGYFPDFKVDFIHKNKVLAVGYEAGLELDKKEKKEVVVKASSNDTYASVNSVIWDQKFIMGEIAKALETGSMMFSIRISSVPLYKSTLMSATEGVEWAICDGLKVVFQNNTGNGTLDNGGEPVHCHIYVNVQ